MDTEKIYQAALHNLAAAIDAHPCPNGRASLHAFCVAYGFNRPHLNQLLLGTCRERMSVGLYLRLLVALGLESPACLGGPNSRAMLAISLPDYLSIDHVKVSQSILALEYS